MIVLYNVLWGFAMVEKMTVPRYPDERKWKGTNKKKADKIDLSVSVYARRVLLESEEAESTEDNTSVIQAKDDHIADLQSQIDGYKIQIEQLHTIILAWRKRQSAVTRAKIAEMVAVLEIIKDRFDLLLFFSLRNILLGYFDVSTAW